MPLSAVPRSKFNARKLLLVAAACALSLAFAVSITRSSDKDAEGLLPVGALQVSHPAPPSRALNASTTPTRTRAPLWSAHENEEKWVLAAFEAYAEQVQSGQVGEFTQTSALKEWDADVLAALHLDGSRLDRLDPTRRLRYEVFGYLRDAARATREDLLPSLLQKFGRAKNDKTWELWQGHLGSFLDDERLISAAEAYFNRYWIDEKGAAAIPGSPSKLASTLCSMSTIAQYRGQQAAEGVRRLGVQVRRHLQGPPNVQAAVLAALSAPRVALASIEHDLGKRRLRILTLVLGTMERSWFDPKDSTALILLLATGYSTAELMPELQVILQGNRPRASWGVVEAIRLFASDGKLGAQEVVDALPVRISYADYAPLRFAALELLATFGGQPGIDFLMVMLQDPSADRETVLENLAMVGGISVQAVLELMAEESMGPSAVRALGALVDHFPEEAYPELRNLAFGATDPALRLQAVRAIGRCRKPGYIDDLREVAQLDELAIIRQNAVYSIGQGDEPEVEFLSRIARNDPDDSVRGVAYQEWMLDTDDEGLAAVFDELYRDSNESYQEQGYLLLGALAHCVGSNPALANEKWAKEVTQRWAEDLVNAPPASLLKQAGWIPDGAVDLAGGAMLSGFDGVSKVWGGASMGERIDARIAEAIGSFASPKNKSELDLWQSFYADSLETDRPLHGLGSSLKMPQRILQLLGSK